MKFFILLFLFFFYLTLQTGIKLSIKTSFINQTANLAKRFLSNQMKQGFHVHNPPPSRILNISNISITDILLDNLNVNTNTGDAITVEMIGMSAMTNFDLSLVLFGFLPNITVQFHPFNLTTSVEVINKEGRPWFNLKEMNLTTPNFTMYNLPPDVESFLQDHLPNYTVEIVNHLSKYALDFFVNLKIMENWNGSITQDVTDKHNNSIFNVTFYYGLTENVTYDPQFISFALNGTTTIKEEGQESRCIEIPPMTPVKMDHDIQIFVSPFLVNCLYYEVAEPKIINRLIEKGMHALNLSFYDIVLNFILQRDVPLVVFHDNLIIDFNVGSTINISKKIKNVLNHFISPEGNATTNFQFTHLRFPNDTTLAIDLTINKAMVTDLNVLSFNKQLIPQKYQTQIQKSNWPEIIKKINELPKSLNITFPLKKDLIIPLEKPMNPLVLLFVNLLVQNVTFKASSDYVLTEFDVRLPG